MARIIGYETSVEARLKTASVIALKCLVLIFMFLLLEPEAAAAQPLAAQDKVYLGFGTDTVVMERKYLSGTPHRGSVIARDANHLDVVQGNEVFLKASPDIVGPLSGCAHEFRSVLLIHLSIPGRGSELDRQRLKLWRYEPRATQYPGISKLVPPPERAGLIFYEFDDDDLRDHWGDKITFSVVADFARLNMQVGKNVRAFVVVPNADGCFFREGKTIAKHIQDFILTRLNPVK